MSNIEEDIKRCEKLIEPQNANWIGITNQLAIAHLIEKVKELRAMCEEYCPKTERIKELEEEKKNRADFQQKYIEVTSLYLNSIPKQKVKDKIEENNKIMIDTQNKYPGTYAMLDEWRNAKAQNDILEELLEDK